MSLCLQNPVQEKRPQVNNESAVGAAPRSPLLSPNGLSNPSTISTNGDVLSRKTSNGDGLSATKASKSPDTSYLTPQSINDSFTKSSPNMKDSSSIADDFGDLYRQPSQPRPAASSTSESNRRTTTTEIAGNDLDDDENSKWIHRDKLARIESEELQAAGIILPKPRQPLKARRDKTSDKLNGHKKWTDPLGELPAQAQNGSRPRKNSATSRPKTPEVNVPSWDLRLPEEILAEANGYWVTSVGPKGTSRIPLAKLSPAPVPTDYIEREAPLTRRQSSLTPGEEDTINYAKPARTRSNSLKAHDTPAAATTATASTKPLQAKRSVTETSPKKNTATTGARKTSAPAKAPTGNKPKSRTNPSKDSTSSSSGTSRPVTRSGELSPSKQPEGEPPWMVSAYRPDPRLPPDQQLLPTVARRLQQEKWEREGKFGSVYDREFRPLTDDGFLEPPAAAEKAKVEPPASTNNNNEEWPLKTDQSFPRSPTTPRPGTSSYSTMPKIQQDNRPPSARDATQNQPERAAENLPQTQVEQDVRRLPEPMEEVAEKKKGCGCCIVM